MKKKDIDVANLKEEVTEEMVRDKEILLTALDAIEAANNILRTIYSEGSITLEINDFMVKLLDKKCNDTLDKILSFVEDDDFLYD